MGDQYPDDFAAHAAYYEYSKGLGISEDWIVKNWTQIKIERPDMVVVWKKVAQAAYSAIKRQISDEN
jgi:hypothetical protein